MSDVSAISFTDEANISFVYDLNLGKVTFLNKRIQKWLHLDQHALSLALVLSFVKEEDQDYLKKSLHKLLSGSFRGNVQFRAVIKNKEKWIRLTPFILALPSGNLITGNIEDITAEMHNFSTIVKYANKKNSILHILSHDLLGPLSIAKTMTQELYKKADDDYLNKLTKGLSKIIAQSVMLITDLTNREFLETIDVKLIKQRVNIVNTARDYIDECKRSKDITKRTFNFESSDQIIYVDLDEAKFMQVLNNLMSNALKFTKEGDAISLNIVDKGHLVLLIFRDNGIGIPKAFHDILFEKFSKARRQGLQGEPSVGLGLSIIKTIIDWHEGSVRIESEEGKGTAFYIEIPKDSP